jgi:hypothetical protein
LVLAGVAGVRGKRPAGDGPRDCRPLTIDTPGDAEREKQNCVPHSHAVVEEIAALLLHRIIY